jgi:hypothetical protein
MNTPYQTKFGDLTASYTDDRYGVGTETEVRDSTYGIQTLRFVKLQGAVAATVGLVAAISDQGPGQVTVDRAGTLNDEVGVVFGGVFLGSCAVDSYAWVVIKGRCLAYTDGGVAAFDLLVLHASTDGAAETFTITSTAPTIAEMKIALSAFGVAIAADNTAQFVVCSVDGGFGG